MEEAALPTFADTDSFSCLMYIYRTLFRLMEIYKELCISISLFSIRIQRMELDLLNFRCLPQILDDYAVVNLGFFIV